MGQYLLVLHGDCGMIKALLILLLLATSCSAAVFKDGFESGGYTAWTSTGTVGTGSTLAVDGTIMNSGTYSSKSFTTNDAAESKMTLDLSAGNYTEIYIRFYLEVTPLVLASGSNLYLFYLGDALSNDLMNMQIDDVDEKLEIYNEATATSDIDADFISFDDQICIELHVNVHDTTGDIDLWKNGVLVANFADVDTKPATSNYVGDFAVGVVNADDITDDVNVYIDDVVVDTQRIGCKRRSF